MLYLCICQQPDNFELVRGHGPVSPRKMGAYELSYSDRRAAQVGDKAQRCVCGGGGRGGSQAEDTMSLKNKHST